MHAYIHACMRACIHTYVHTYVHTYIHTYIHTYVHTYALVARRINIDFNSCATHRIEIPKRTRLGEDFQKTTKIFSETELSRVNSKARPQVKIFFQLLFRLFQEALQAQILRRSSGVKPRRLNFRRYIIFVENLYHGMSVWGFRYEMSRLS